jgi:hypothetical protein
LLPLNDPLIESELILFENFGLGGFEYRRGGSNGRDAVLFGQPVDSFEGSLAGLFQLPLTNGPAGPISNLNISDIFGMSTPLNVGIEDFPWGV